MSESVTIQIHEPNECKIPPLGVGLWVDRLQHRASIIGQLDRLGPNHVDVLVDLRQTEILDRLDEALSLCHSRELPVWLYAIVPDAQSNKALRSLARHLNSTSANVAGVLLTPAAYLASYQPDGAWPSSISPAGMLALGREIWPTLELGGGFPTYFTELNRCRPDPTTIDFLTHATSPIVHAADDLSVMESLESLPHIFSSARKMTPDIHYRVTTSAIGAWTNPYGGTLTPNPGSERVTLSDNDPRQRGLFAAAWNVGYMAQAACHVDSLTLSSLGVPFPITGQTQRHPLFNVLRGLNRGAGRPVLTSASSTQTPLAMIGWRTQEKRGELWIANTTPQTVQYHVDNARIEADAVLDDTVEPESPVSDAWPLDKLTQPSTNKHKLRPFAVTRLQVSDIQSA